MQGKEKNFALNVKGKKSGLKRLIRAIGYSVSGLKFALEEAGFRELLFLHSVLLVTLIFIPFPLSQKMLLILSSGISLIVELLNTALEAAVDHTSLDFHPLAKRAKDTCSAAQYLSLIVLFILWGIALCQLLR